MPPGRCLGSALRRHTSQGNRLFLPGKCWGLPRGHILSWGRPRNGNGGMSGMLGLNMHCVRWAVTQETIATRRGKYVVPLADQETQGEERKRLSEMWFRA